MTISDQSHDVLAQPYPLTEDDVAFYEQNGWLRMPGLLDAATVAELNRRFDGLYDALRQQGAPGDPYLTEGKYHRQHRIFNDPSRVDEFFRAVALSERVASVARALTRCDQAMYLRSTVFEKPSEDSLPTTLHQDFPYQPFDRSGSMQMWIALHDLPANSGTLRFVSGSHRTYGVIGRTNVVEEEQERLARRWGKFEMTEAQSMAAGDATVHDDLTIHGADANEWDRPRRGFTVTYAPPHVKYTGAHWWVTDGLGLPVNEVIRHERFPLV